MKIGHCQLEIGTGDFAGNLTKAVEDGYHTAGQPEVPDPESTKGKRGPRG